MKRSRTALPLVLEVHLEKVFHVDLGDIVDNEPKVQ